jgi:hypothetical protein
MAVAWAAVAVAGGARDPARLTATTTTVAVALVAVAVAVAGVAVAVAVAGTGRVQCCRGRRAQVRRDAAWGQRGWQLSTLFLNTLFTL